MDATLDKTRRFRSRSIRKQDRLMSAGEGPSSAALRLGLVFAPLRCLPALLSCILLYSMARVFSACWRVPFHVVSVAAGRTIARRALDERERARGDERAKHQNTAAVATAR